jgi:BMFP domain-containing protein YqiC
MSEFIWETFDGLFKTVHRQGRRVEELEARIADLEQRLNERVAAQPQKQQNTQAIGAMGEMPAERAA